MKTIEQLGISPAPWTNIINSKRPFESTSVWDARNGGILTGGYAEALNDARLIAAAPELYKALFEDVTFYCEHCLDTHNATECPQKNGGDCKILEWRKLLEKAGGAE